MAIVHVATGNARRHVAEGRTPEEAAMLATPGAWAEYRAAVFSALLAAPADPRGPADA